MTEFNPQKVSHVIEQALILHIKQYGKIFLSRFLLHRDREFIQATSGQIAF